MIEIKNKLKKITLVFWLILLLATTLRVYSLSSIPPSASLDEASIGYNAYSILRTGADEYGTKFPLLLRAYDDFRPALYVYLVIPFVYIFDLTVFSVRFPSIILSVLTIIATYFLVKELFPGFKSIKIKKLTLSLEELVSLLLTISPWHIYLSRLGHEANAGLAFGIFGILFFLRKRMVYSLLFFSLAFMSYQTQKIFIPMLVFGMILIFWRAVQSLKKNFIIGIIIAFLITTPFLVTTFSPNALIRFRATNVFSANSQRFYQESIRLQKSKESGDFIGVLIHNRRVLVATLFLEGYVSHFNPNWIFLNFSSDKHKVPDLGLLYLWELPFVLIGIMILLFSKRNKRINAFLICWILISPIAAALTTESPHAMRGYVLIPVVQIISGLGVYTLFLRLKSNQVKIGAGVFFMFLIFVSIIYLSYKYYIVFPKEQSSSFQYSLSQAIPYVLKNENKYPKVVFSNTDNLYQSYMFFLFYSKYDPWIYQKQGGTQSGGYAKTHKFGKYEFRPINWEREKDGLYIGNVSDFPSGVNVLEKKKNLNDETAILIVEKKIQ